MLKSAALALVLLSSASMPVLASTPQPPNPTEQEVQAIFGQRLSHGDRPESLLLLAVAMDQQAQNSPTREENIGIPYIAGLGAGYWVRLLQQEKANPRLDTLVNNALILIYAEGHTHPDDITSAAAHQLLTMAAERGYWPAQVYLTEHQLSEWRRQGAPMRRTSGLGDNKLERTLRYLKNCAQIGFAPCQFQLGFWYLQEPPTQISGLDLLKAGIEVVRRDQRYTSSSETMQDMEKSLAILAEAYSKGSAEGIADILKHAQNSRAAGQR
jgi:TPR repeat protein